MFETRQLIEIISYIAGSQRRRRSSLAQLTDILREWSGGGSKRNPKAPLNRRETLADLARSLPWGRTNTETSSQYTSHAPPMRKRRESSADSGIKSMRSRRESNTYDFQKASETIAVVGRDQFRS